MNPPVALSLVTNASTALTVLSKASGVTGKSGEEARPVTTALPEASTAMPWPISPVSVTLPEGPGMFIAPPR
jgi:hypothetical protein